MIALTISPYKMTTGFSTRIRKEKFLKPKNILKNYSKMFRTNRIAIWSLRLAKTNNHMQTYKEFKSLQAHLNIH